MKPVSRTAFYCAGIRMLDAERPHPICGDTFARRFMTEEGLRVFEPFRDEVYPNGSNVTRHRIIDDLLRHELARDPDRRIVIIGAGFDSRAYRLAGGRWVELDEPALMAFKEERLPGFEAPNPLQRVSIDFAAESIAERLGPFRGETATVVLEGVSMYLTQEQKQKLVRGMCDTLGPHTLLADLMTRTFIHRYGGPIREKLSQLGAVMIPPDGPTEQVFVSGEYRLVERISIPSRAAALGAFRLPGLLQWTLLRPLVKGYQIHRFERD